MEKIIELKVGNILDRIREMPDNSIDCIVTSPPYYGLRSYRGAETIWGGSSDCKHEWIEYVRKGQNGGKNSGKLDLKKFQIFEDQRQNTCLKCGAWKGQLGLEPDYHLYLDHLMIVTSELKRVLKPTGTLWWNMGDSYAGNMGKRSGWTDNKINQSKEDAIQNGTAIFMKADYGMPSKSLMQLPTRFAIRMVDEQGWILRNTMIWYKRNHMPSSVRDRLANSYEFIFFFTKQKKYFFNLDAVRVPVKAQSIARAGRGVSGKTYETHKEAFFGNPPSIMKRRDNINRTKQDEVHNRTGTYSDPLHTKPFNPLGKNPGDILELATHPFKNKVHFAVFPPKLPEFCIKAGSPEEVCSACGKPKVHVYEPSIYSDQGKNKVVSYGGPYAIKEREGTVAFRKLPNIEEYKIFLKRLKQKMNITIDEIESKMQSQAPHHWFNGESLPTKEEWLKFKSLFNIGETPYDESLTKEYFKPAEKLASPMIIIGTKPTCSCNAPFKPGVVLDPFAGSGTTMFVAKQLGRSATGIEISPEYAKIIKQRLDWGSGLDTQWIDDNSPVKDEVKE